MEKKNKTEAVQWTEEQKKVIYLRNRNILVSAAAGSGKTAVLVERIIKRITSDDPAIDIDKMLIVTFTNAAAAQMRERIAKAIEKKIQREPENAHLQKQMTLIHNAQITTIHSFCLNVIKNHFHEIDLEPGFRIGDEAELKLLRGDIFEQVLEESYGQKEEKFLQFIESYATGRSDGGIEEIVLQLYEFSRSYPWPKEWLEQCLRTFEVETVEELQQQEWMEELCDYIERMLKEAAEKIRAGIQICQSPNGPYPYEDALREDCIFVDELLAKKEYFRWYQKLSQLSWKRLSAKKDLSIDEEKKNQVKHLREEIKKIITDIKKQFFYQEPEQMLEDMQRVAPVMEALVELTLSFSDAYKAAKEEKKIIDFNDLEHFALHILVEKQEEKIVPSKTAIEYSEEFEEILIDEYQDSNLVQETILNSISKERFGMPNVFMVGDVKQSIYKFRLARPELFMEKYNHYTLTDGKYQRIDLSKNFRSREIVLNSINYIFRRIMHQFLGNIEYDEEASLHPGASFPEPKEENINISTTSELLLVTEEAAPSEEEIEEEALELSIKELEARAVVERIKELTDAENGIFVLDEETKEYRRCRLGDIVILLRTMSGWAEVFVEQCMAAGIIACTDTQSGYFSATEVQNVLNYLKILDNPRQDIPLAAVLHSPFGGFDNREMAVIRSRFPQCEFYEALELYGEYAFSSKEEMKESCIEASLSEKINHFLERMERFREKVPYTPLYQLLEEIYEETKYLDYVTVMPAGEQRRENLKMLVQKAIAFESGSYSGLFQFNCYIEKLQKYEIDFGEANLQDGSENAVHIMSIHKSKGLEFPVVFVSGMGKMFNQQDTRGKLALHPEMGIGPDYIDPKLRQKTATLVKKVMQKQMLLENLGEELRVLYVALTRAKEKLIMTGYVKRLREQMEIWEQQNYTDRESLSYTQISGAKNYLDWVGSCLVGAKDHSVDIKIISLEQLSKRETIGQLIQEMKREELTKWEKDIIYHQGLKEMLEKKDSYEYPFVTEEKMKNKITVSELKRLSHLEMENAGEILEAVTWEATEETEQIEEIPKPKFMQATEQPSGTGLGTLYHKIFELLPIDKISTKEEVASIIDSMAEKGRIKEVDRKYISVQKVWKFVSSALGKRVAEAQRKQKVWREQPFVMGVPAKEIYQLEHSEELVLVQGMIDLYFEEEEELVLVDYKTDRVQRENGETVLKQRYHTQLEYYEKALEQLTGKRVKETVIYSVSLGRAISL